MRNLILKIAVAGVLVWVQGAHAQIEKEEDVRKFLMEMVDKHGFDHEQLISVISRARISDSILEAIMRPAEAKPWYQYRPIFLQDSRIRLGVDFMKENKDTLHRAERLYGVPPEIITAIIGVETRYGQNAGNYKVIDSLVTLGFRYPQRGAFFRNELEQFLLLTREQGLDPHVVKGSYAGAMGIPQFISSSYRHYAVDFNKDEHIDIWGNPDDAIGSVANYFKMHGWQKGQLIAARAELSGDGYARFLTPGIEPDVTLDELSRHGVSVELEKKPEGKVKLFSLETGDSEEVWVGFRNFYAITRYNRSVLYAMAVLQLSEEIVHAYRKTAHR